MLTDSELSDDAPEDVTFQQTKEASALVKRGQAQSEKLARENRKLRNKKRDELFTEQKVSSPSFRRDPPYYTELPLVDHWLIFNIDTALLVGHPLHIHNKLYAYSWVLSSP